MANEKFNQPYFDVCVRQALEDIKQDYATGITDISQTEYDALIQSYESMLNGENAVFHYRARMLTQMELYLLTQKMSKGLLFQHQKSPKDDIVALAIQLKRDADLRQLGELGILNSLL